MEKERNSTEDIFRVEQSVMTKINLDRLYTVTGDRVAESILAFICYQHQFSLFGYGILNPEEFAKLFGYSGRYLREEVEHPFQEQMLSVPQVGTKVDMRTGQVTRIDSSELVCKKRIENALFTLANYVLSLTITNVETDRILYRSYSAMRLFDSFAVITDRVTGKILYQYHLDERFRRSLATLYLKASLPSIVALRPCGLGAMYFFLVRTRDAVFAKGTTSTLPERTPSFDELCKLADIPSTMETKYRKRKLKAAFDLVRERTELDYTVEWVKNGGKEKYTPIFHFIPAVGQIIFEPSSVAADFYRKEEKLLVAVNEFKHNLYEACPKTGDVYSREHVEKIFYEWLKSDSPEFDDCLSGVFSKSALDAGCFIPRDIDERVKLFKQLVAQKGAEYLDEWVIDLFSGSLRLRPQEVPFRR